MEKMYQKRAFGCLRAKNRNMARTGSMQIAANAVIPDVVNTYNANRNRRKSTKTLPPKLFPDAANAFVIYYFA
jgi:hypothetical protein